MKESICPSIFIGLGDRGSEIAASVSTNVCKQNPNLSDLHVCITMDNSKVSWSNSSGGNGEVTIDGLENNIELEVWSSNYNTLIDHEREIEDLLIEAIQSVRSVEVIEKLKDSGNEVRSDVMVMVYSPIFDAIGSAALIPYIVFIKKALRDQLKLYDFQLNLVLFGPNLFDESEKEELSLIRSYCCIAELDHLISAPEKIITTGTFPVSNIWLLEKGDESHNYLSSYEDIIPMISESARLLLLGAIQPREMADRKAGETINGKGCYYSSFGLKSLIYPVDDIMFGIQNFLTDKIIGDMSAVTPESIDKGATFADAHRLFMRIGVADLIENIKEAKDGSAIWQDFAYTKTMGKDTNVELYVKEINKQFDEFVSQNLQTQYVQLSERKSQLITQYQDDIWKEITENINGNTSNGICKAVGLLAALLNREDEVFSGVNPAVPLTLDKLRNEIYAYFYDRLKLTPLLLRLDQLENDLILLEAESNNSSDTETSFTLESNKEPMNPEIEDDTIDDISNETLDNDVGQTSIDDIREEIDEIKEKLTAGDRIIEDDQLFRNQILNESEKTLNHEFYNIVDELSEVESKYKKNIQDVAVAYEERSKLIKTSFILIPIAIIILITMLGTGVYYLFDVSFVTFSKITIAVGIFTLLVWLLYSIKQFFVLRTKIIQLEGLVQKLKSLKINTMICIQENRNIVLRSRFDYYSFRKLLEWYEEANSSVENLYNDLHIFSNSVQELVQTAREKWNLLTFENSLFKRYVVDQNYVKELINKFSGVEVETKQFFDNISFADYFKFYLETDTIDKLNFEIKTFVAKNYSFIQKMTIDNVIEERMQENSEKISGMLYRFFDSIKSLVVLSVEPGMDKSEKVIYMGVPDPGNSQTRDIIRKNGNNDNIQYQAIRDVTKVVGIGFKIGFPAFYWSQIEYSRSLFRRCDDRSKVFCNNDWQIPDVVPISKDGIQEIELARLSVIIAEAAGLISFEKGSYMFDKENLGDNRQDVVELIQSIKGINTLRAINDSIEEAKSDAGNFVEKLRKFIKKHSKELDTLDIEGLNKSIDTTDPLA